MSEKYYNKIIFKRLVCRFIDLRQILKMIFQTRSSLSDSVYLHLYILCFGRLVHA